MDPIRRIIFKKNTQMKPIWFMRQAGRYLPEFRKIRSKNKDFIKLCLNQKLVPEITLQPLRRFNLDAAIIFSDILMLPYGLNQTVNFKKNYGPILGKINYQDIFSIKKSSFLKKLKPVYKSMDKLSKRLKGKNKTLLGFVGAPWTILIYMINRSSPKRNIIKEHFFLKNDHELILDLIVKYLKIHIYNQVKNGATCIQIFDSWAGLVKKDKIGKFIYRPTAEIVKYTKSLNVPVICFPRNISDYKIYSREVQPDCINIDYNVDPKSIIKQIDIPIQGGLDPKILLSNKDNLKKNTIKILNIFKDHPYIFNLGHGVLPQTNPNMVDYLVKLVKDF